MTSGRIKVLCHVIIFIALFCLLFSQFSYVFSIDQEVKSSISSFNAFFTEPDDTIQVVVFGNSRVMQAWNPLEIWNHTGITSYNLCSSRQLFDFAPILLEEVRRTQSPDLVIIDINSIAAPHVYYGDLAFTRIVSDITGISVSAHAKMQSIGEKNMFASYEYYSTHDVVPSRKQWLTSEIESYDRVYYDFPVLYYHSRWTELGKNDFIKPCNAYKSVSVHRNFEQRDIGLIQYFQDRAPIDEYQTQTLRSVLDYFSDSKDKVLFISAPASLEEIRQAENNTILDIINDAGYQTLNFTTQEMQAELGLDIAVDFYDKQHLNILGSKKFSLYMAEYLRERYPLADRRGDGGFESWDSAYEAWLKYSGDHPMWIPTGEEIEE